MRRSAAAAAKTRLALLEAALLAFADKGWRGATFEQVAERAGVTRGAVNHHFRDKAALLSEALEWGWAEYGEQVFAALDGQPGRAADGRLRALLSEYVRLLGSDGRFRALASTTVLVAPQALTEDGEKDAALDAWRERIAAVIAADPGHHGTVPAAEIAGLVLVLLQGFTVTSVTRPHDLPQPENLDAAIAALVRGLLS